MRRVYFIRPIGMVTPVKIGCSISPDGRRDTLESWSPFPLEIIAEIEGGYDTERRFHALFDGLHERREWFTWSQHIEAVVRDINAGTFDLSTLPPPKNLASGRIGKKHTPECRLQMSYTHRLGATISRTGFSFPDHHRVVANGVTAQADEFLKAPHIHGNPIDMPWAEQRRQAWLASLETEAA